MARSRLVRGGKTVSILENCPILGQAACIYEARVNPRRVTFTILTRSSFNLEPTSRGMLAFGSRPALFKLLSKTTSEPGETYTNLEKNLRTKCSLRGIDQMVTGCFGARSVEAIRALIFEQNPDFYFEGYFTFL